MMMMPIYGRDIQTMLTGYRLLQKCAYFLPIFEVIQKKKMLTVVKYNGRLLYLSTWTKINTLK